MRSVPPPLRVGPLGPEGERRCLTRTRPMSDASNLLGQAANLDPAIRERVISLANLALDHAEFLIKHGDPNMKARLLQTFMTTFAQHMRTKETDTELEDMRKQLSILTDLVNGRTPGQDTQHPLLVVEPEIEEAEIVDMPPGSPPTLHIPK